MIRLLDIIISTIALLILSPLFLIVTILISLDDNGPIFFLQTRVGKNLVKFKIIKFRTMIHDKNRFLGDTHNNKMSKDEIKKLREQVSTSNVFDPRITRIGIFLRKTSIDELPQLMNVILGEMSLVGPRPDTPIQEVDYSTENWIKRHFERPGITGLSQIMGRSEINLDERIKFDLEYINSKCLYLYFKIIIKTIFQVIKSKDIN
jgi:lipopolysaccharide/colanic/teichoic acid biosynthesis glycosyltransferase